MRYSVVKGTHAEIHGVIKVARRSRLTLLQILDLSDLDNLAVFQLIADLIKVAAFFVYLSLLSRVEEVVLFVLLHDSPPFGKTVFLTVFQVRFIINK